MEYATQRAIYAKDQEAILFGYQQLQYMLANLANVTCDEEAACTREKVRIMEGYVYYFDVQGMPQV